MPLKVKILKVPPQYVYLLRSRKKSNWYKIGFSNDPARRAANLNEEMEDLDWHLVAAIPSKNPRRVERAFHEVFASRRITRRKEWFALGDSEVELFLALAADGRGEAKEDRVIPTGRWSEVLDNLKHQQRNPAAAAYFEESSRARWFHGRILRVFFPLALPEFYVRTASRYTKPLKDAVKAVTGGRPTEVRYEVEGLGRRDRRQDDQADGDAPHEREDH